MCPALGAVELTASLVHFTGTEGKFDVINWAPLESCSVSSRHDVTERTKKYSEEENSSSSKTMMPHVLLEQRWQLRTAPLEVSVSFKSYL